MRRGLRWRLRGIAGMAIKPGLQRIDLLLQLGYYIGAGHSPKPRDKPELLEEVFPKSLEQSALVLGYTFFRKIPSPLCNFFQKYQNNLPPLRRGG